MERPATDHLQEGKDPLDTGIDGGCDGNRAASDPSHPGKGDGSDFKRLLDYFEDRKENERRADRRRRASSRP